MEDTEDTGGFAQRSILSHTIPQKDLLLINFIRFITNFLPQTDGQSDGGAKKKHQIRGHMRSDCHSHEWAKGEAVDSFPGFFMHADTESFVPLLLNVCSSQIAV